MNFRVLTLLALMACGFTMGFGQSQNQTATIRCSTMEADQLLREQHPEIGSLDDFENWIAPRVESWKQNQGTQRVAAVVTIPVVFHIVHNGDAVGSGENISATYVQAQIDQMNNDFRRTIGTSGYNTNPVGADTEIEFCLATLDPSGATMAEPGIRRYQGSNASYSQSQIENLKPSTQWDPTRYLNIWSVNLGGGLLGYAQFPEAGSLPGIGTGNGAANTDGVVVLFRSIGSSTTPFPGGAPYNQGRTLTHEVGHWLGLRHIWGDGGCSVDDFCNDTPTAGGANYGCTANTSCGSSDMIQNYMDYTDDGCMNIFTQDQKARMQVVMGSSPRRASLATSDRCGSGGGGGGITCGTTISSFPYAESFESGLGAWSQASGDDLNWTRDSGGTPSSGTGPASAQDGTWYMYIESSTNGTGFPNKQAILEGPCFDLAGASIANFSFAYNMNGAAMGSLSVEANDGSGWTSVWSLSGNQGAAWGTATVDLSAYIGGDVKLRFNGITGSNYTSDITIDDIAFATTSGGGGGGGGCTGGITSFPYTESFESGIGSWSQASGDDLNWTRDSGGTPSSATGPSTGAAGSWYMYIESSGNGTGFPSKRAIFNSPCFNLSGQSSASFDFSYHMYGSSMGTLTLEASSNNGASWTSLWSQSGNKGNSWLTASVDLAAYLGGSVQLRFNGVSGSSYTGDMAIDDISLSTAGGGGGGGCANVNVSITLDNYPGETTWSITSGATTLASGGPYGSQPAGSTVNQVVCLPNGCYTFTINDSYGDGICCTYGNGSYTVSEGSTTYASGGSFTTSQSTNFCVTSARYGESAAQQPAGLAPTVNGLTLFPNPTRSALNVAFESDLEGEGTIRITDLTGKILLEQSQEFFAGQNQTVLNVRDLAQGTYLLLLNTKQGQLSRRFVVMD